MATGRYVTMSDGDDFGALADTPIGEDQQPTEEGHAPVSMGRGTPPAGRYTLQLPPEIEVKAFQNDETGQFESVKLTLEPMTIINPGGPGDGEQIRFHSVTNRKMGSINASGATDLCKRLGVSPFPRTAREWYDVAVGQLANQQVENVYCDWFCRVKQDPNDPEKAEKVHAFLKSKGIKVVDRIYAGIVIKGMKNFPSDGNGGHQSKLTFEDFPGGELVLYANLAPTGRGFGLTQEEIAERESA